LRSVLCLISHLIHSLDSDSLSDSEGDSLDEEDETERKRKEKERRERRLAAKLEKANREALDEEEEVEDEGGFEMTEEKQERKRARASEKKERKSDLSQGLITRRRSVAIEGHLSQELLRKYILFAKSHVHPKLDRANTTKLSNLFVELRKEPVVCHSTMRRREFGANFSFILFLFCFDLFVCLLVLFCSAFPSSSSSFSPLTTSLAACQ
jgi:hypothetical protein